VLYRREVLSAGASSLIMVICVAGTVGPVLAMAQDRYFKK
jgi:hypothetical protein